jgi:hypothetical protein
VFEAYLGDRQVETFSKAMHIRAFAHFRASLRLAQ